MVIVRIAGPADIEPLGELLVCWPNGSRLLTSPDVVSRPGWQVFIAVDDDAPPLGYAVAYQIRGGVAHVDELLVHPDHHRKEIGRLFLTRIEQWARSIQCSRIELGGGPAPGFYEKVGYRRVLPGWHYLKDLGSG